MDHPVIGHSALWLSRMESSPFATHRLGGGGGKEEEDEGKGVRQGRAVSLWVIVCGVFYGFVRKNEIALGGGRSDRNNNINNVILCKE